MIATFGQWCQSFVYAVTCLSSHKQRCEKMHSWFCIATCQYIPFVIQLGMWLYLSSSPPSLIVVQCLRIISVAAHLFVVTIMLGIAFSILLMFWLGTTYHFLLLASSSSIFPAWLLVEAIETMQLLYVVVQVEISPSFCWSTFLHLAVQTYHNRLCITCSRSSLMTWLLLLSFSMMLLWSYLCLSNTVSVDKVFFRLSCAFVFTSKFSMLKFSKWCQSFFTLQISMLKFSKISSLVLGDVTVLHAQFWHTKFAAASASTRYVASVVTFPPPIAFTSWNFTKWLIWTLRTQWWSQIWTQPCRSKVQSLTPQFSFLSFRVTSHVPPDNVLVDCLLSLRPLSSLAWPGNHLLSTVYQVMILFGSSVFLIRPC